MSGSVKIARALFAHEAFKAEPFTEREAFIWLIMEARWKAGPKRVGTAVLDLERGQLAASVRYLAEAWGWSKSRVDRYLGRLEKLNMICSENGTAVSVITVCNYDEYQGERDSSGTAAGQQRDSSGTKEKKGEIREEGKEKEPDGSLSSGDDAPADDPPPIDEIAEAVSAYNGAAPSAGWPSLKVMSKARRSALRARLKDAGGIAGWRDALGRAAASDFLCGRAGNRDGPPFVASFDFLTRQSSFAKLMEGNYDNRPISAANPSGVARGSHPGRGQQPSGIFGAIAEMRAARGN